jgi:two-component system NtrC family sensor kinase
MFKYQTSIRQKIIFGYYVGVIVIAGLCIFTFFTFRLIEKKIMFGEVISELFDSTLEIRRFEKNIFLYEQDSDFNENIQYVKKAQDILDSNIEKYKMLTIYQQLNTLNHDLKRYKGLMEQFATLRGKNSVEKQLLEKAIRQTGKEILTISENVSKIEMKKLRLFLNKTMMNLILAIIFLSLGGITVGQILSRMIVKPLESLEEEMRQIAEGKLETVAINSRDREIVSLTKAFNKMLKELDLRQKHLVQSEKLASLGTLLSGVAHELNNPLSNISSSCQILVEEFEDADTEYKKELLSQIDEQTERARNIVRSLLEFTRHKEFKKDTLPLKKLIEETILFVKGEISARVKINLDIPDDILILADKQRIQQVFLNLIKNALESIADEGSLFIRARKHILNWKIEEKEICEYPRYRGKCTGECPVEKDTVDIEIKDTGSGVPPEVLPKIFDPFFTTKDAGKSSGRGLYVGTGSGLGLYIVEEIIQEHTGCIGVDSEVGKGTCFLIRLPIRSDNAKNRKDINR